eukprot:352312-Chlamydomonas_euryale.AAC.10
MSILTTPPGNAPWQAAPKFKMPLPQAEPQDGTSAHTLMLHACPCLGTAAETTETLLIEPAMFPGAPLFGSGSRSGGASGRNTFSAGGQTCTRGDHALLQVTSNNDAHLTGRAFRETRAELPAYHTAHALERGGGRRQCS